MWSARAASSTLDVLPGLFARGSADLGLWTLCFPLRLIVYHPYGGNQIEYLTAVRAQVPPGKGFGSTRLVPPVNKLFPGTRRNPLQPLR